jgi:hypothetical protein
VAVFVAPAQPNFGRIASADRAGRWAVANPATCTSVPIRSNPGLRATAAGLRNNFGRTSGRRDADLRIDIAPTSAGNWRSSIGRGQTLD